MRRIQWAAKAVADLMEIADVGEAAAVDAAVQSFAATGAGFVRVIARADMPDERRLYAARLPYYVIFRFDDEVVYVWRVMHR